MDRERTHNGAVIFFPLLLHGMAIIFFAGPDNPLLFVSVPVVASQPLLLAAWAALSTSPFRTRLPVALGLCLSSFYLVVALQKLPDTGIPPEDLGFYLRAFAVIGIACVFHFVVCYAARDRRGLCIVPPGFDRADMSRTDRQFGLRDLLHWTAWIAVALTIGKLVLPVQTVEQSRGASDAHYTFAVTFFSLALTIYSLPALCFVGVLLDEEFRWAWFKAAVRIAFAVVLLPVLLIAVFLTMRGWHFPPNAWRGILLVFLLIFSQCLAVVVTLAPLAGAGWRLERIRGQSPSAGDSPPQTLAAAPSEPLQ